MHAEHEFFNKKRMSNWFIHFVDSTLLDLSHVNSPKYFTCIDDVLQQFWASRHSLKLNNFLQKKTHWPAQQLFIFLHYLSLKSIIQKAKIILKVFKTSFGFTCNNNCSIFFDPPTYLMFCFVLEMKKNPIAV